jgi:hypothetical protein
MKVTYLAVQPRSGMIIPPWEMEEGEEGIIHEWADHLFKYPVKRVGDDIWYKELPNKNYTIAWFKNDLDRWRIGGRTDFLIQLI